LKVGVEERNNLRNLGEAHVTNECDYMIVHHLFLLGDALFCPISWEGTLRFSVAIGGSTGAESMGEENPWEGMN
jgi:hypothetical protein